MWRRTSLSEYYAALDGNRSGYRRAVKIIEPCDPFGPFHSRKSKTTTARIVTSTRDTRLAVSIQAAGIGREESFGVTASRSRRLRHVYGTCSGRWLNLGEATALSRASMGAGTPATMRTFHIGGTGVSSIRAVAPRAKNKAPALHRIQP